MPSALRSIPLNVWRSEDFDCEAVFNEIFKSASSFDEIQNEIKERLDENSSFFSTNCSAICTDPRIYSQLAELSTVFELENEKMEGSLEKAKGFASELERVAGDIIKLAKERKELNLRITRNRQLTLIKTSLDRIDSLIDSINKKFDFKEISNLLLATEELLSQFQIQSIKADISDVCFKIELQRRRIGSKVIEIFEKSIDDSGKLLLEDPTELFSCCLAADILENNLRAEMIKIYLDKQFKAYRTLHPMSLNVLDLKTIGKRFKWAQRMLNFYEKTFKLTFPSDWQVEILFAQAMGNWIKEDIATILSAVPIDRRVSEDIFTQSLSEANSFDRYITLRFKNKFTSTVTQAFQDFHYFLFEAKEDEFNALKRQILPESCLKSLHKVLKKDQLVIANFDQFFMFFSGISDTFVHLSSMSSGILLVQFSFFLCDCLESLNEYIETQFQMVAALQVKKWTDDVGKLVCCLLNTLDYCLSSSQEQINRILSQIRSEDLRLQVTLEPVQQKLLVSQTVGMSVLLTKFESDLLPVLQSYLKTDWDNLAHPLDPSPFYMKTVESLESSSRFSIPQVIHMLQPQTCRLFLEKLINMFMRKLQNALLKFKFINEIAAEQLMIDLFSFRSYFTQRIVPSGWKARELATWSQVVAAATDRYELHLKVLLTPVDPVGPFVQSYLLLLTDFNLDTFLAFLDVKGVAPAKRADFTEEFTKHAPPTPSNTDAPAINYDFVSMANSAFDRLKSTLNVVNVIKRTYTRSKSRFNPANN